MSTQRSPLALILYAGEPSLQLAIESVESQSNVVPRFLVIGNHPKRQAHDRLFQSLNQYTDDHDFSIFLGADMEIANRLLFSALGGLFDEFLWLDNVLLGVDDWYSGEHQLGVNVWRRGIRHTSTPNGVFTDIVPNSARTCLKIERPLVSLIIHGINPSARQAIRYGAQRGMKAAALGKESRWNRLAQLVEFTAANPDPKRRLALAGIKIALTDRDLGRTCIAGTVALEKQEIAKIEEIAESKTLLGDLHEMVRDIHLRTRLAAERSSDAVASPQRRRTSRLSLRRRSARNVDFSAAEDRFFALLEGSSAPR